MTNDIVKKLSTRRTVPGTHRLLILDRLRGSRDFNNSQLCSEGSGNLTTPWLLEKARTLSVYENRVYTEVDRAIAPLADRISIECQEIKTLTELEQTEADNAENRERAAAHAAAREAANERRRKEIYLQLAEIRSELEGVDTALKHHLQRAENETWKHISAYWSGVLRAAASKDMPVKPFIEIKETGGKEIYLLHFNRMMDRISEALDGGENHEEA